MSTARAQPNLAAPRALARAVGRSRATAAHAALRPCSVVRAAFPARLPAGWPRGGRAPPLSVLRQVRALQGTLSIFVRSERKKNESLNGNARGALVRAATEPSTCFTWLKASWALARFSTGSTASKLGTRHAHDETCRLPAVHAARVGASTTHPCSRPSPRHASPLRRLLWRASPRQTHQTWTAPSPAAAAVRPCRPPSPPSLRFLLIFLQEQAYEIQHPSSRRPASVARQRRASASRSPHAAPPPAVSRSFARAPNVIHHTISSDSRPYSRGLFRIGCSCSGARRCAGVHAHSERVSACESPAAPPMLLV